MSQSTVGHLLIHKIASCDMRLAALSYLVIAMLTGAPWRTVPKGQNRRNTLLCGSNNDRLSPQTQFRTARRHTIRAQQHSFPRLDIRASCSISACPTIQIAESGSDQSSAKLRSRHVPVTVPITKLVLERFHREYGFTGTPTTSLREGSPHSAATGLDQSSHSAPVSKRGPSQLNGIW